MTTQRQNEFSATIGLFSGRPNPRLSIGGPALEELTELLKATIGREPIHPPPPATLGKYYGFILETPPEVARRQSLPARLRVYAGVVTEVEDHRERHWRDTGGVERFLLRVAFEQGYGDVLQHVGVETP